MKADIEQFPERMKAIRKAHGMTQEIFLAVLREGSRAVLGDGVRTYSQSTLSRLESGKQPPTLEDVAVLAAIDPQARGKLWLGWNEVYTAPKTGSVAGSRQPATATASTSRRSGHG